jgi:hypothetical protein
MGAEGEFALVNLLVGGHEARTESAGFRAAIYTSVVP